MERVFYNIKRFVCQMFTDEQIMNYNSYEKQKQLIKSLK